MKYEKQKYEIDEEIVGMIPDGAKDVFYKDSETQKLILEARRQFWAAPIGCEIEEYLRSLGLAEDLWDDRLLEEIEKRWGSASCPGIVLRVRLEEVGQDLLNSMPKREKKTPAVKVTVKASDLAAEKAEADLVKELNKITKAINYMLVNLPASAFKPQLGVVKLTWDGKDFYDFPVETYEKYVAEIVARRIPTVYPLQTNIARSF